MRNLLALVGLATVTFVGLGWYLGWYKIQRAAPGSGDSNLQIGIDTKKVSQDVQRGVHQVTEAINSFGSKENAQQQSWYDPTPTPKAPPATYNSWSDPTPVPPPASKPSAWRNIPSWNK
jgi:hypothetical protein